MADKLPTSRLLAYGLLSLPLAFAALPVYIIAPKFYVSQFGVDLAALGGLLLVVRLIDGVQDPLLGYFSDRLNRLPTSRYRFIAWSAPGLAISFIILFIPHTGIMSMALWFAMAMVLVSTFFGAVTVAYTAVGSEMSTDYHERSRISAFREGFGLVGVLIASILPQVLSNMYNAKLAYEYLCYVFVILMALCTALTCWLSPRPLASNTVQEPLKFFHCLKQIMRNKRFLQLVGVFTANGIAAAIPATLVLFYIDDVIVANAHTGYFLATYFLSGACGMPFWTWLSRRTSKKQAWMVAMAVSIITFFWAYFLGADDLIPYYVVCVLSGLCLGANLVLPVSILADVIHDSDMSHNQCAPAAAYFGWWSLASKISLAAAGGIALPLASYMGYAASKVPTEQGLHALSFNYALLPCFIQLGVIILLAALPLEQKTANL